MMNPPNIGLSLPIDIRGNNDDHDFGVKYVVLTSTLPTSIEGKEAYFIFLCWKVLLIVWVYYRLE